MMINSHVNNNLTVKYVLFNQFDVSDNKAKTYRIILNIKHLTESKNTSLSLLEFSTSTTTIQLHQQQSAPGKSLDVLCTQLHTTWKHKIGSPYNLNAIRNKK